MPHPRKCKMRCMSFSGAQNSEEHGVNVVYILNELCADEQHHTDTEVSSIHWRVEGRHGSHQGALTSS